jgi:hypothetical protein
MFGGRDICRAWPRTWRSVEVVPGDRAVAWGGSATWLPQGRCWLLEEREGYPLRCVKLGREWIIGRRLVRVLGLSLIRIFPVMYVGFEKARKCPERRRKRSKGEGAAGRPPAPSGLAELWNEPAMSSMNHRRSQSPALITLKGHRTLKYNRELSLVRLLLGAT